MYRSYLKQHSNWVPQTDPSFGTFIAIQIKIKKKPNWALPKIKVGSSAML
jgi:hypothetical protein